VHKKKNPTKKKKKKKKKKQEIFVTHIAKSRKITRFFVFPHLTNRHRFEKTAIENQRIVDRIDLPVQDRGRFFCFFRGALQFFRGDFFFFFCLNSRFFFFFICVNVSVFCFLELDGRLWAEVESRARLAAGSRRRAARCARRARAGAFRGCRRAVPGPGARRGAGRGRGRQAQRWRGRRAVRGGRGRAVRRGRSGVAGGQAGRAPAQRYRCSHGVRAAVAWR
jgi:hypothetical protein